MILSNSQRKNATRSVGIHVSVAKSIDLAVDRALDLGCIGTFQIFTCSPRRWAAPELDPLGANSFKAKSSAAGLIPFAHMPYMPNISSSDNSMHAESTKVLVREIRRCNMLGVGFLVVHFGSPGSGGLNEACERVVKACNKALDDTSDLPVKMLLEGSANAASAGSKFESIAAVLDKINEVKRLGVCLDTCHMFSAGYDFRSNGSAIQIIEKFDSLIGIDRLNLIHMNDSKVDAGSGKDRHEHIGLGTIRDSGFEALLSQNKARGIPLILETPIDSVRDDRANLAHAKKILSKIENNRSHP